MLSYDETVLVEELDAGVGIVAALSECENNELAYSFYGWLASLDRLDWCL
jgi:hypothetical protein